MRRTVPPSAEIEEQIERLLAVGVGENARESLSELARLGARLIIQRAAEDEFDAWSGRARYERRPDHQRGLRNYDSGPQRLSRTVQTLEGELRVELPQVREAASTGADTLAVECPFCTVVLDDGVRARGEELRVVDVSTLLAESLDAAGDDSSRLGGPLPN